MSEIVNTQNLQIQAMYDYLDAKRLPEADNCEVLVETVDEPVAESGGRALCLGLGATGIITAALALLV